MIDSFYIAWKYLIFSKARSATLVACITLIAVLPLALEIILDESEQQLVERAEHTPLLVGARGSALDLVMNSLYFADEVPEFIRLASVDEITATDLAVTVPLYVRFQARGFPIVGTTLDYFDFRQLRLAAGKHSMGFSHRTVVTVLGSRPPGAVGEGGYRATDPSPSGIAR